MLSGRSRNPATSSGTKAPRGEDEGGRAPDVLDEVSAQSRPQRHGEAEEAVVEGDECTDVVGRDEPEEVDDPRGVGHGETRLQDEYPEARGDEVAAPGQPQCGDDLDERRGQHDGARVAAVGEHPGDSRHEDEREGEEHEHHREPRRPGPALVHPQEERHPRRALADDRDGECGEDQSRPPRRQHRLKSLKLLLHIYEGSAS